VVGASDDESKYGNWIGRQALRTRARRPVYLVNRRGESVLGEKAYRTLADVPEPVDLVVIAVPAAAFEQAVTDALAAGARAIVGISAGFAELGAEGERRQAAVVARVRDAGAVLVGPNCLGVMDSTSGLFLTSDPVPEGPVGLISQSGNVALELGQFLRHHGLGFSRFASLGNQADLTAADLIRDYTAHDGTGLIAVYCEDFADGRQFCAAAADAAAAGKPVVLLPAGWSAAAARGAASHTGALTSGTAVIDAACRAAGVDRVASPREMAGLLAMLHSNGMRSYSGAAAGRVAVIADGGGQAAVASDVAEAQGLAVPRLDTALSQELRGVLPPSAGVANPVDLAGAGLCDMTAFAHVLRLLLARPEIDALLLSGSFGGYGSYSEALRSDEMAAARTMADLIRSHRKPVAVHTMFPDSAAAGQLRRDGVPVFAAVDDAARALGLLARHAARPRPHTLPLPAPADSGNRSWDATGAGYWEARQLLGGAGLPFPSAQLAADDDEAVRAARELGYPVVVKALGLTHKSDAGGVALGLGTATEVRSAVTGMRSRLAAPGFSVEAMADTADAVELIAGVRDDPRFGPVAMIGLGGIFAEVMADVSFALAPVDVVTALGMLRRLRGAAVLTGLRGRPPVDLPAAAHAMAALTTVAAAHPEIAECEINPLLVTRRGCLALDARIVPHKPARIQSAHPAPPPAANDGMT
jgi:acyl-CoA synthetase (NDP forming)